MADIPDGWEALPKTSKIPEGWEVVGKYKTEKEHSTLGVIGESIGKGTKDYLLNMPKNLISGAARLVDSEAMGLLMPEARTEAIKRGLAVEGKHFVRERVKAPISGMDLGENIRWIDDTPARALLPKSGVRGASEFVDRNFDVGQTFDALGIAHRPPPAEELTTTQRILGKAAEVMGGAVPIGAAISAFTKAPLVGQMVQAGLTSVGTGVGEEIGGPVGGLVGGLALPLVGPAAAGVVRRMGRGSDPANLLKAVDDAANAGTNVSLGQGTGSRFWSGMESTTGRFGGIGVMQRAGEKQAAQMGQTAEKTAATLAPKMDDAQAGQKILESLTGPGGYVERFKSMADRLFKKVNHTGSVRLSETTQYLDDATGVIKGAEATSGSLVNPALKTFYGNLIQDVARAQGIKLDPKQIEAFIGSTGARPAGVLGTAELPFEVVKGLRSAIGRKIGQPGLIDDIPKGDLKRLYGALSADVEASLISNPVALRNWNRANDFYRQGVAKIESTIEPIKNAGAPEKIMSLIDQQAKRGGTELRRLMTSLKPTERDIISAQFIRDMGKATPANQLGQGTTEIFSPVVFLQRYGKLKESGADKVLFDGANKADLRKALDGLLETSKRIKKGSQALANPSNTAAAQFNLHQWLGYGGVGGLASVLTGNVVPAATVLGSLATFNGLARMMTSPKFVRWLARSTTTPAGLWAQQGAKLAAEANDPDLRDAVESLLGGRAPPNRTPE